MDGNRPLRRKNPITFLASDETSGRKLTLRDNGTHRRGVALIPETDVSM